MGAPRFGPGDAAQVGLVDGAARGQQELALPAPPGDVADDRAVGPDRERARVSEPIGAPGAPVTSVSGARTETGQGCGAAGGVFLEISTGPSSQPSSALAKAPLARKLPAPLGSRSKPLRKSKVGAAVAFLAAAGIERVGDHPGAVGAPRPGEAAVADLARELRFQRGVADFGVAPGAGHRVGAEVVIEGDVGADPADLRREVDPGAVRGHGERLRGAADRRDPAIPSPGSSRSANGVPASGRSTQGPSGPDGSVRAGPPTCRASRPARRGPRRCRGRSRRPPGSGSGPRSRPGPRLRRVSIPRRRSGGSRRRSSDRSGRRGGRYDRLRRRRRRRPRRRRCPPPTPPPGGLLRPAAALREAGPSSACQSAPRVVGEDDDLFRDRALEVAADEDATAGAGDPRREAIRNEPAIGLPGLIDRGVEDLPAGGVGVAEEGQLGFGLARPGRRREGQLAGPDADVSDRQRQHPVAPRFARLARRGGAHQGRLEVGGAELGQRPGRQDRGLAAAGRGERQHRREQDRERRQMEDSRPHRFPLISLIRNASCVG